MNLGALKAVLLVSLLFALCPKGFAQSGSACDDLKEQLDRTILAVHSRTAIQKLAAYLHLLSTVRDDPQDCITTAAMGEVSDVEKTFIHLEAGKRTLEPDWVLACHSVDLHTGECGGLELDPSAHLPEKRMGERLHRTVPRSSEAMLRLQPGYAARVLAAFASTESGWKRIPLSVNRRLSVKALENASSTPAIAIVLRRNDMLRYRKVVWHLYPLEPTSER